MCLTGFSFGSLLERENDGISVSRAALGLCKHADNFGDTSFRAMHFPGWKGELSTNGPYPATQNGWGTLAAQKTFVNNSDGQFTLPG